MSSSSSSSPNAPRRHTPPSETPLSPVSAASDEDLDVHPAEDGFELRQLPRHDDAADNERGRLLGDGRESDDEAGAEEEVLYDAFGGEEPPQQGRRKRGHAGKGVFDYTTADERKVVRKMDRYLVGSLAVLYMLSFLDRSNVGNAKIAGMMEDLDLTGDRYETILMAFYITYIAFEWMTLLWKVFPAHTYVSCTVIAWGIIASLQALSIDWRSMAFLRALLGIAEAAFGPGVPFYLSLFYRREELAFRTGLFISAAPLATAYAGFLAYAITSIPSPIASWRLLFILEGFPSIIAGIAAFYIIPDSPGDAWFLNTKQRQIARRRLLVIRDDDEYDDDDEDDNSIRKPAVMEEEGLGLRYREIWIALKNPSNWITAFIFFFANISFASLPVFLPTIIHELGFTSTSAQALSIPPYLLSFFTLLLISYLSDRYQSRSVPLLILAFLGTLGYILLGMSGVFLQQIQSLSQTLPDVETPGVGGWWSEYTKFPASKLSQLGVSSTTTTAIQYTGLLLTAAAIFPIISLVIVWNGNNSQSETGRGAGMALLQMLGQCGPLLGTRLYPVSQAPGFVQGSFVCAGAMAVVAMLVGVQRWRLGRKNRAREKEEVRLVAEGGGKRRKGWRYML